MLEWKEKSNKVKITVQIDEITVQIDEINQKVPTKERRSKRYRQRQDKTF